MHVFVQMWCMPLVLGARVLLTPSSCHPVVRVSSFTNYPHLVRSGVLSLSKDMPAAVVALVVLASLLAAVPVLWLLLYLGCAGSRAEAKSRCYGLFPRSAQRAFYQYYASFRVDAVRRRFHVPDRKIFSETDSEFMHLEPSASTGEYVFDANEIEQGLWMGSLEDAHCVEELRARGITHICTVQLGVPPSFPDIFAYHVAPVMDVSHEDVLPFVAPAVQFVENARRAGGGVLVHCNRGVSRSGAITCAVLMRAHCISFDDALDMARTKPGFDY